MASFSFFLRTFGHVCAPPRLLTHFNRKRNHSMSGKPSALCSIRKVFDICVLPRLIRAGLVAGLLTTVFSEPALATQGHGHPAGLYAHQAAHVFFMFSMGLLIFWLRHRGLIRSAGWRYIQYASFFFIIWNANAFLVHFIEEQSAALNITRLSAWQINIEALPGFHWLAYVYYVAKLDHLLCVPALLFLYLGLKRLLRESPGLEGGAA